MKCQYPYLSAIICFHFYISTIPIFIFFYVLRKKKSGMELHKTLRTHRDGLLHDYDVRLLGFIL